MLYGFYFISFSLEQIISFFSIFSLHAYNLEITKSACIVQVSDRIFMGRLGRAWESSLVLCLLTAVLQFSCTFSYLVPPLSFPPLPFSSWQKSPLLRTFLLSSPISFRIPQFLSIPHDFFIPPFPPMVPRFILVFASFSSHPANDRNNSYFSRESVGGIYEKREFSMNWTAKLKTRKRKSEWRREWSKGKGKITRASRMSSYTEHCKRITITRAERGNKEGR